MAPLYVNAKTRDHRLKLANLLAFYSLSWALRVVIFSPITLGLPLTIAIFAAAFVLFAFSSWRAYRLVDPLKPRMINYAYVQFIAIFVALLMGAHILTLMGVETGAGVSR